MCKINVLICFLSETVFSHGNLGSDSLTFIFIASTVDKNIDMLTEWNTIIFVNCKN